jgi:hypothetical protein
MQQEQNDGYMLAEMGIVSKQRTNYLCKMLTAGSDTSTHGGFSVPRVPLGRSSPLWCDEYATLGSVPFLLHHGFWVCCCQKQVV